MEKDLEYWKNNAEEDYLHVPISVLRYITELEQSQKQDKKTFLKAAEVEVDLMEEVKKKAETIYSDSLFNEADNNAIRLIFIHGAKYYKELTKKHK